MSPAVLPPTGPEPAVLLFDAGGTLVLIDPAEFAARVDGLVARSPSPRRLAEAHYRAMTAFSARLAAGLATEWTWWLDHFLTLLDIPPGDAVLEALDGARGLWSHPIAGVESALRALRARGHRLAVVSNADGTVREGLVAAGLAESFELIIDSSEVGVSKPDPGIFHLALRRLDVGPGDAWHVGDSVYHDLGGARAAGLAGSVLVDPLGLGPSGQVAVPSVAHLPALLAGGA